MAARNIKYGNDFFKTLEKSNPDIFFEEALQGNWDILPVNPQKQAEALRKKFDLCH